MPKTPIRLPQAASAALIATGTVALLTSIYYVSSILAFIGLGLVFWGAILAFIQTEEHAKKSLLDASIQPSLATLNQLIKELDYKGNAIYLPPKYFQEPESVKIYIQKKGTGTPTPEEVQKRERQLFAQNPQSLLLTPPGAGLAALFEKTLETSLMKLRLEDLQNNLQKLFIEDLEIAENIETQMEATQASKQAIDDVSLTRREETINVKITNTIYKDTCKEARQLSHICKTTGCPLCSSIAIAIVKASGKPLTIEKAECTENGTMIEASYRLIEE